MSAILEEVLQYLRLYYMEDTTLSCHAVFCYDRDLGADNSYSIRPELSISFFSVVMHQCCTETYCGPFSGVALA